MDNNVLVDNIRILCKSKNIPISQLEKELDFGSGLISRWTKADPSLSKIVDIADFFNVSLDEIVGREEPEQESFIPLLLDLTRNKEITWEDGDTKSLHVSTKDFEIIKKMFEIYYAEFSNGYFYLLAQYDFQYGRMEEMDLQIYIQPSSDCKPVLQIIDFDELYELWLVVRKNTRGLPDEYKANMFINHFLKTYNKTSE